MQSSIKKMLAHEIALQQLWPVMVYSAAVACKIGSFLIVSKFFKIL